MANRRPAPINIACVIHDLDRGGAQRILGGLLNRIVDRSIQRFPDHPVRPHLITLADGSQDAFSLDTSIPRTDLDVMGDSRGWLDAVLGNRIRIRALARTLREIRPDVVLSFCDRTNVTALLAAAKQYPVIISEHSDPTRHPIGRFWGWLRRKYYPRAASIIALTDTSAGYLQRIGKQAPVVIPGAIEVPAEYEVCAEYEAHDPSSRSSEERFTWCAVGRLSAEKNFAAFVDAFSQIARRFAFCDARIVGDGPLRETLQAQINELNLAERINITGWTDNVWQHYRAADAFALTSHYEGFPGALLEAMAMGLPVVSVDCESGPRAMVEHEQNGLLIPPNDPDALVDAMQRVTESRSLRQRLGTAAVQVRQRFGWTRLVDAHLQVVYSLLNVT